MLKRRTETVLLTLAIITCLTGLGIIIVEAFGAGVL